MAGTATTTLRSCLKQPMKDAALTRDVVYYTRKVAMGNGEIKACKKKIPLFII